MTEDSHTVNTIAPITNVALCASVLGHAVNRPPHLPGIVAFYGPSGLGKSSSVAFAANKFNAYHVECKSNWTQKALLSNVLKEMGIKPAKTNPEMTDQVSEQLARSQRPLIIDEFDHVVKKKIVELVRDIYEGSHTAILIIGEEQLEDNLTHYERFHNRVLKWVGAQPASIEDAHLLKALYCDKVDVGDDIVSAIMKANRGCTRRICINLYNVQEFAIEQGLDRISMTEWGNRAFYTGKTEKRRL